MDNGTNKILVGALVVLVLFLGAQSYFTYQLYQKVNVNNQKAENITVSSLKPTKPSSSSLLNNSPWDLFDKNDKGIDPWSPFEEMQQMHDEMNKMFGRSFSRFSRTQNFDQFFSNSTYEPRIDMEDERDHYLITVDVPGAEESTINVSIEDGQLRLSGNTAREKKEEDSAGSMVHRERFFGSFERTILLPDDVDEAGVKQEYKDGVLSIRLPKRKDS